MSEMNELIERLDALYAKATKGEWQTTTLSNGSEWGVCDKRRGHMIADCYGTEARGNARLMVALVNAWPEIRKAMCAAAPAGKDGWIDVKERLPEQGKDVLAGTRAEVAIASLSGPVWCYAEDGCSMSGVTHWQPLPAAPSDKPAKRETPNPYDLSEGKKGFRR